MKHPFCYAGNFATEAPVRAPTQTRRFGRPPTPRPRSLKTLLRDHRASAERRRSNPRFYPAMVAAVAAATFPAAEEAARAKFRLRCPAKTCSASVASRGILTAGGELRRGNFVT